MGKQQPCRNGCGVTIEVKNDTGRWLPYVVATGELHKCTAKSPPPAPTAPTKKSDNYYDGIRKTAELGMVEANSQLQDPKWTILKIVERQIPILVNATTTPNYTGPDTISTQTNIVYILGLKE